MTGWMNTRNLVYVAATLLLSGCGSDSSDPSPSTGERATAIVSCDSAHPCASDESCITVDGHYVCSVGPCHNASDCEDGYACHAGECLQTEHTKAADCPANSVLHDHFGGCGTGETPTLVSHHPACFACVVDHADACTTDHGCDPGQTCHAGECIPGVEPVACPEGSTQYDHFSGCHEGETASHLEGHPHCIVCTPDEAADPCRPGEPATVDSTSCHPPTALAYRWNGHACEEVSGCSLVHAGDTFVTLSDCAHAHVSCDSAHGCASDESWIAVDGNYVCSAGPCHNVSDCEDGYACHAGECLQTEQTEVADCPANSVLHDHFGGCGVGETPTLVSHHPACIACVVDRADPCTTDHGCDPGQSCQAGECIPGVEPVACPEGSIHYDHFSGCHEGETASHPEGHPHCIVCTPDEAADPCRPGEPATVDSTSCHHPTALAYRWNGHACEEVSGCSLVHAGDSFATLSDCAHAHVDCSTH